MTKNIFTINVEYDKMYSFLKSHPSNNLKQKSFRCDLPHHLLRYHPNPYFHPLKNTRHTLLFNVMILQPTN